MGYINLPVESSGGGGVWGTITGTLSDQSDLNTALNNRRPIYGPGLSNPSRYSLFSTDFEANDRASLNAVTAAGGGSGLIITNDSTYGVNTTENAFGVWQAILGTGTTARASVYSSGQFAFGTAKINFGVRLALPDGLSDGTNTYILYAGLCDNPGAGDVTDGAYFKYTHSINGGRWEAVVAAAGVRTAADTGVAAVASEFNVFEIEVNQAGTEVKFYINGTLTNTVSSGLPGAGDFSIFNMKIEKSAGTTSRSMALDWVYLQLQRTSER